jgi:hypothetical protein
MTDGRILVIVHPGSACGSANFHLGKYNAQAFRDGLVDEIEAWKGGVIVLSGELDDELAYSWYGRLGPAIDDLLARAKAEGMPSARVKAHDPDQIRAIKRLLKTPKNQAPEYVVTGAWAYEDGTGCVYSVIEAIQSLDFKADVSDTALSDATPDDAEDGEEETVNQVAQIS